MKKVNLIIIVALAIFLLLSFFSIPKSSLFSPSLKNLKPFEMGVLYKYCISDSQCDLNQKCFKNSCRNKICTDTDGGIVPEIFGTVSVSLDGIPSNPIYYPDVCAGSLNIKEFYCNENNNPSIQEILCPGVCLNGACAEAVCGDGILSSDEQCDGTNLDGKNCADFGFDSGVLTCDANCQFDTSQCFNNQDCTSNIPPTAILPDDISNWPVGKPLTISSQSTDSDGEIVLYSWDFGDGTTQETFEPFGFHTYNNTGFFTITLKVTDNCGANSTETMQIYSNLTADFFFYPSQVMVGETAYFEAYAPVHLVYPNQYRWSFIPGGTLFGKNISRNFATSGNYSVTLRVVTKTGQVIYSAPQTIEVISPPPELPFRLLGIATGNSDDVGYISYTIEIDEDRKIAWLYRSNGIGKLVSVNISNSSQPSILYKSNILQDSSIQIARSGNLLAVAGSSTGSLHLFNITNPVQPVLLSTTNIFGTGVSKMGVVFHETNSDIIYLSGGLVKVYNISNPSSPQFVTQVMPPHSGSKLRIDNNLLYCANGEWGAGNNQIAIYNVSNPISPAYLSSAEYTLPIYQQGPWDFRVKNSILAINTRNSMNEFENGALVFFNISNPSNPQLLSIMDGYSEDFYFRYVGLGTNYAYTNDGGNIDEYDISNPSQPVGKSAVVLNNRAHEIVVAENGLVYTGLNGEQMLAILGR